MSLVKVPGILHVANGDGEYAYIDHIITLGEDFIGGLYLHTIIRTKHRKNWLSQTH